MLDPEEVPELDTPLELALLTEECSWENRGQMSRTSARDFVEALLLDVHHAQYLQAHPHVPVRDSILQDQLLGGAETAVERDGDAATLARLHQEARRLNLEASRGRIKSDWIEPETLFWGAWNVLPAGVKAASPVRPWPASWKGWSRRRRWIRETNVVKATVFGEAQFLNMTDAASGGNTTVAVQPATLTGVPAVGAPITVTVTYEHSSPFVSNLVPMFPAQIPIRHSLVMHFDK